MAAKWRKNQFKTLDTNCKPPYHKTYSLSFYSFIYFFMNGPNSNLLASQHMNKIQNVYFNV